MDFVYCGFWLSITDLIKMLKISKEGLTLSAIVPEKRTGS
jgi:hypothetical protein